MILVHLKYVGQAMYGGSMSYVFGNFIGLYRNTHT